MKTLLLRNIRADIFMAVLAELRLGAFVESLMALRAVLLPLGMAFDDLPGHESGFNIVSPGYWRRERQEAGSDRDEYAVKRLHGRCV